MRLTEPLPVESVNEILDKIKVPTEINRAFVYDLYLSLLTSMNEFSRDNAILEATVINHISLLYYLVSEHVYYLQNHSDLDVKSLEDNEGYQSLLASIIIDKYLTNDHLEYQPGTSLSRYYPPASSLTLYLNFVLGTLKRFHRNDPNNTLIIDVLNKGFSIAKCIIDLLVNGFETEAFATWRTLHETEAVLIVLTKNGPQIRADYLRHLTYGVAFRDGLGDKDKTDLIFVEIKEEMKKLGLKSKDMKRFIEYGWLRNVPGFNLVDYKLNFRDGLEKIVGLTSYSHWYEMSSEVAHSSPILIYGSAKYFGSATLVNLFDSFFRLEQVFGLVYGSSISGAEKERYNLMRSIHFPTLKSMAENEHKRLTHK